jgi:hypothetical protein
MENLFWVSGEIISKFEYYFSYRTIYTKGSLLGLVVGEAKKWVLNLLPAKLQKRGMSLVF